MTDKTEAQPEALRVRKYVARRSTSRGLDREHIHGFDIGDEAEALLLTSDLEAILGRIAFLEAQLSARQAAPDGQWKCGNEYLPYHPSASHVHPAYRDGWNDCYRAAPPPPEREPLSELQKQALDMYKPPFQFHHGYIFDSAGHMFADEGRPDEAASLIAVRIRGWGRLGKLSNGAEVQDAAGHLAVAALNAFWKQHAIGAKND
ncbi:hypothetical protein [Comamonas sp.]|uniref:hypothetical protein n=1 Tax=Comamonas sp. TaxID=34028 RepID=UPI002898F246|nr:hypothetical protein [Comamonas sp.]